MYDLKDRFFSVNLDLSGQTGSVLYLLKLFKYNQVPDLKRT